MSLHICYGPPMVERKRESWGVHWCFRCRAHLAHDAVLMVQDPETDPSYWGDPYWKVECSGCGEDHVRFPGTEDGPTLDVLA